MRDTVDERVLALGVYIAEQGATVRAAADKFGVSKSTVHKDVTGRLKKLNPPLYAQVRLVLDVNKSERHIRGGMATKEKYLRLGGESDDHHNTVSRPTRKSISEKHER